MTKVPVICNLCNKPFVNLKNHQRNKHPTELKTLVCPICDSNSVYDDSGLKKHYEQEHPTVQIETKLPKPTIKDLQNEILGLEDQLKVSNNDNGKLIDEMEARTRANDVENERLRGNNRRITNHFNSLRQIFNDKSSELSMMNEKYAVLESESQGYRDRYDIIDHGHEKTTFMFFFIDLYSPF